jgi:hypothetical protein
MRSRATGFLRFASFAGRMFEGPGADRGVRRRLGPRKNISGAGYVRFRDKKF